MALCAVNTKTIRFGTAVTNMVYRDPTITANSFATLNEVSEGRAIVGLTVGEKDRFEAKCLGALRAVDRFVNGSGGTVKTETDGHEWTFSYADGKSASRRKFKTRPVTGVARAVGPAS